MAMGRDSFLMCTKGKDPRCEICSVLISLLAPWPEFFWREIPSPPASPKGPLVEVEPQGVQRGPEGRPGAEGNEGLG